MTENQRLKALYEYDILDTVAEPQFDAITRLISYICDTPAAFITFIDEDRQWIKSNIGIDVHETSRDIAFCNYTIQNDSILEIEDLQKEERFTSNPFVTDDPNFRFYAGAPLITPDGLRIGSLCVVDSEPRKLDERQRDALKILSTEVIAHMELKKKNRELVLLLEKAQKFNQLFNNSNEIHCITNSEGRIEFINDSVKHLLGYNADEVLGKSIWDLSVTGERDRVMPVIYEAIAKGENRFQVEILVLTKNGQTRWFEWSDVIMDGHWLVNGRDITERKTSEQKLEELSIAVKKSHAGVIIRNPQNEVRWINEAAENILGHTFAELHGKIIGDLLVGKNTDLSVLQYAKDCTERNQPYEIEIEFYKKNGTPVWLFISNNPLLDSKGQLESQISIVVDISLRKEAEAQLIKTRQDAIDLSKAKETFLSVMSHEMRTPLNAVLGISRILKEESPLERQLDNLNILEFSAQNLLSLINDVLDFTKIETENLQLESVPFDIHKLVRSTIQSLTFKAVEKKIRIRYHIDSGIPAMVMGDSTRLYQIFMNILGNSLKFTEKGEVNLQLKMISEDTETVSIRFDISDTGIGIPEDNLKSIFNAYSQAGTDISRKYGGTGLGLAITSKLIELHHSSIAVHSTVGKGSVFSFDITFQKAAATSEGDKDRPAEDLLNTSVLVVDDNAINRLLAKKVLEKWGVNTDFAENGKEAIDKIKSNDYDLVFMDIHMPEMDGLAATRVIRAMNEEKYQTLPIIALTASVLRKEEDNVITVGMNDFVLKPFEPKTLYNKLILFTKGVNQSNREYII